MVEVVLGGDPARPMRLPEAEPVPQHADGSAPPPTGLEVSPLASTSNSLSASGRFGGPLSRSSSLSRLASPAFMAP
jgi:hypothetical protein